MANRRSNRSAKKEDEADVTYSIDMPFHSRDAKILLIAQDDGKVEVIVGDIPMPANHELDRNYPDNLDDEEKMREHAAAQWIFTETTTLFSEYDWEASRYKTHNPNYHLRDVYFTCERSELDEAVLAAKKFLADIEEKSFRHAREFDTAKHRPLQDLPE